MKISSASIGFLSKQYRNILIKCAMINMGIFGVLSDANAITYNDSYLVDGKYELTGIVGTGGITEDIGVDSKVNSHPVLVISGKVADYNSKFWAQYDNNVTPYSKYETIIFKNWDEGQRFKFASNGFYVFDDKNSSATSSDKKSLVLIADKSSGSHLFLNGHTLDKNSTNVLGTVYLGAPMTDDNGRTVVLDGYSMSSTSIYSGGLRNSVKGDVNTTVKNSTFKSIFGNGQSTNVDGDINLTIISSNIGTVEGNRARHSDPDGGSGQVSASLVTGDINVDVKDSTLTNVVGMSIQARGKDVTGIEGNVNINIENSTVSSYIRGITSSFDNDDKAHKWMENYYRAKDFNINVKDSSVGDIYGLSSYMRGENVSLNVSGNTDINNIYLGSAGDNATAENTFLKFDTSDTITVNNNVYVGAWSNTGIVNNAFFELKGGGNADVGSVKVLGVEGTAKLDMENFDLVVRNDISGFNEINIDDKSTLDASTLKTESDAIVNVKLTDTSNYSKIKVDELDVNGAKINLNIGDEGVYNVVDAGSVTSDFTWNLEHNLYQATEDNGTVTVKVKSAEKFAEDLGVSSDVANSISSAISADKNGTDKGQEIANIVKDAINSGDVKKAIDTAKDATPSNSKFLAAVTKEVANTLASVSFNRLDQRSAQVSGLSSGDENPLSTAWVEAVSGHAKQDSSSSSDGFSADISGVTFGFDKKIDSEKTVGIGYGYMTVDSSSLNKDMDIKNHNFFVYGKYQPSQWYARAMLGYSFGEADEKKSASGIALNGKFDISSYNAQVVGGYELGNGFTPEAGIRYVKSEADGYFDGMQYINYGEDDILTAVAGVKYTTTLENKLSCYTIKPTAKVSLLYDLVSDSKNANAWVAGGNNYRIGGERLDRFGVETALGLTATKDNLDVSVEYNGELRGNYEAHMGILNVKYHF